ncbi:GNAT family N-acetyltransferase [Sphingomonas sp. MAH-20]|uniref:GNAT family N-acetyltransferase n=1 Tax=Sphingomonas horti TaxID=2682842 RepID=A0A6I4J143_9SPHN|nr:MULTISPECIES: GNAT family N-acetyltransferase [Sphingomonas]MBA2919439.1 GNAT family N-acetyltransferase [Sphingomonas sp. CGMCC 1.13658]MVO78319.1 GNAT family N-acetyltransferase [Sphingomonas horti]
MSFAQVTERLVLRSWREEDVDAFEQACNTPAVMRYLGGLQTRDQIEAAVARIRACEAEHGYCFWAVERRADRGFLGFCGLKPLNAPGAPQRMQAEPEIGWRLREDTWGQGYAKEAARAALDLAFSRFGMRQVYAITMTENAPSWGLMRRLGMAARPQLDFDMPGYGRHVTYRIGSDEWTG